MPQSRLPDINTAFIMYRREVLQSLNQKNYDNCFGALYALNGLLPAEYRVKVSSIEYSRLTTQDIVAKCNKCDKEIDYKSLKVMAILAPLIVGVVSGQQYHKIWVCPECKFENKLTKTAMIQKTLQEPYFLRVVPKPPQRKDGLFDRSSYHRKVIQWVWNMLDELEERMAQFRDDNWTKSDNLYNDGFETDTEDSEEKDV